MYGLNVNIHVFTTQLNKTLLLALKSPMCPFQ